MAFEGIEAADFSDGGNFKQIQQFKAIIDLHANAGCLDTGGAE